ncbi:aurora kinase A-interacting protein-like [Wyeomyia smithii]|uniref:aurora kinase A-interacting protein-like n=1 Tax=Wyeomyia smithii TaxID=174621 RepID=UPI002467FFC6|nr:aurora kinase A-interacting protein-like [Wyeomyia smithii]
MLCQRSFEAILKLTRRFSNVTLHAKPADYNPALVKTQHAAPPVPLPILQPRLLFRPREISLDIGCSPVVNPLLPRKEIIDVPRSNRIIENPNQTRIFEISENPLNKISNVELPTGHGRTTDDSGIQAARLIVIRRRKMRKHKLRKLRKKMKFEWAKVRQRRELRKEKAFQAELINQIKQAEKFSAEMYVAEKLRQATETPIPRLWKGKRLPQFIIKQKLGIE